MSVRKRLHRDDPARSAPIRHFSKLYRRNETKNGVGNPANSATTDNGRVTKASGKLAEGVELAYRVIDKHIVEGRQTAEQLNKQPYSTRPPTDSLQELLERLLRFQADMLPLWVETLSTLVIVDPSRNPFSARADAMTPSNGAGGNGASRVSIELLSTRPVRVSLDLREHSEVLPLVVLGLHSVETKKPPLTHISFKPAKASDESKLSIRIPQSHPAGTYSGVIVNRDTGEARGTLSVRIEE